MRSSSGGHRGKRDASSRDGANVSLSSYAALDLWVGETMGRCSEVPRAPKLRRLRSCFDCIVRPGPSWHLAHGFVSEHARPVQEIAELMQRNARLLGTRL